ncbi:MAG: hypothetical protein KY469_12130 [Actinobacteria bacterium]|nr:hypothetical protein [Actinomycetota bacterium]
MTRYSIESWAPDRGSAVAGDDLADRSDATVAAGYELPVERWRPLDPISDGGVHTLLFVDGVQRTDALVWITDDGLTRAGQFASYGAGVVRCDGRARIEACAVRRSLFATGSPQAVSTHLGDYLPVTVVGDEPDAVRAAIGEQRAKLEIEVVSDLDGGDLIVIDGPLRGRQHVHHAIGYVKSHHVSYLPDEVAGTVGALAPGQRTPVFGVRTSWSRLSWYVRLPGRPGHPWAGIARCDIATDTPADDVRRIADATAVILPRFASDPHKDPRAPQNLYPIAGLERELRRRLGDPKLLERALRAALAS